MKHRPHVGSAPRVAAPNFATWRAPDEQRFRQFHWIRNGLLQVFQAVKDDVHWGIGPPQGNGRGSSFSRGEATVHMCIFTGQVDVGATKIFAAPKADGGQYLLYQMVSSSATSVAMILPIPVPPGTSESAVRFLDLKFWPDFFEELSTIFPSQPQSQFLRRLLAPFMKGDGRKLEVFEVGDYVASFVPSLADFSRLDDQFRLSQTTWDQLPGYSEFGFAVFQLASGLHRMHPMGFEFPRCDPRSLFFPTVHVHDGQVHSSAEFDHALYCQTDAAPADWECSVGVPSDMGGDVFQLERWDESYRPFLDLDSPVYRRQMRGTFANEDVVVRGEATCSQ